MHQASAAPRRVRTTLVIAIYVAVLVGGLSSPHGLTCSSAARPHCAVCASIQTVSTAADAPPAPAVDAAFVGVVPPRHGLPPVSLFSCAVSDRAPPA